MSITCSSVEINEFNSLSSQDKSYLNVLHLNIRSVNCNLSEFILVLDQIEFRFSIIVLSETFLFYDENAPIIEGYTAFLVSRDRNHFNRGGGLLVYVQRWARFIVSIPISSFNSLYMSSEKLFKLPTANRRYCAAR